MSSVPLPTAAEAGAGLAWFNSQAGIVATVLAVVALALAAAYIWERIKCGKEMEAAWARVTAISEARTADALATIKALGETTAALGKVATLVDSIDRRAR